MLNTRVDYVVRDEKYLSLYKQAGILFIDLGMEAAVQTRLNQFHKETTIEMNRKSLELLRLNDIISIVQIQIGHPDDDQEFLQQSLDNLKVWNPDLLHFYYVTPIPWTAFGHQMKEVVLQNDISKWDYRHPILKLKNMTPEELVKLAKKMKLEFNFNPSRIASVLKIKDDYRRKFVVDSIVRSLKYRAGESELSNFL